MSFDCFLCIYDNIWQHLNQSALKIRTEIHVHYFVNFEKKILCYIFCFQKKIWCHILSILSVFKWKLIVTLWVFFRHWKESCGFHCFPSVQNGRSFSLLLTQRSHHTCTFWAMLGMYASKYGLLVALIFNPFCFCLLLSFYQRLECILSLLIFKFCEIMTVKGEVNMSTVVLMNTCCAILILIQYSFALSYKLSGVTWRSSFCNPAVLIIRSHRPWASGTFIVHSCLVCGLPSSW